MNKKIILIGAVLVVFAIVIGAINRPESNTPSEQSPVTMTPQERADFKMDQAAVVDTLIAARYTHPRLGFSFQKPEGYTVGSLKGSDGSETLIVQPSSNSGGKKGFQIFITPLDAPIELTPNLIKSELPGTSVNNAQKIVLDGRGKGMMFSSNNDAFGGKSFEIWFNDSANMYQVSSYAEFSGDLQGIIGTWKF